MSHTFHSRVALTTSVGEHIRYLPSSLAHAMVLGGTAQPRSGNGRVRSISLARPAEFFARRIGPPTEGAGLGVRFYRWQRLEMSASRIVEHHPRCTYEEIP